MDADAPQGTADLVGGAGRHWEWVLAFGIVTIAVGVLVLAWPGRTIGVLAVLFGIELIAAGIFRFVAALASDDASGGTRVLLAVLGVLSFVFGLFAIRNVALTVTLLAVLLGIFWVVNGAMEAFSALAYRGTPGRGLAIGMGVLSILAGVVVLAYPGMSLVALAVFLGIWLLVLGALALVRAFQMRSVGRAASRLATAV